MMTPFDLPPDDLRYHAVCLGGTGSGKTGMGLGIVESVALAGVPTIVIDPKGDGTNLALTPSPHNPIHPSLDPDNAAATWATALLGDHPATTLDDWHDRVRVHLLTPGADAAPVDLFTDLLRAPNPLPLGDDLTRHVGGQVASLLAILGITADPLRSPEAILLATLLERAWAHGERLDLSTLLDRILRPPLLRVGGLPTDAAIDPDRRQRLAVALNNVLAAPGFTPWRQGEPLDLAAWSQPDPDGKTPIRVLTLAHLSDAERAFFLTTFLHALVAHTRSLPGSGTLRLLVVVDELYGWLPPHPADPPTKRPLLTLLKQARAVGVGLLLAAQNAMDLDHKALANCGTWIVGQLRTENDRRRVAEGLDLPDLHDTIAALAPRTFAVRPLRGPVAVFRSRHTRCWLRGPLTLPELRRLLGPRSTPAPPPLDGPPILPHGIDVRWLTIRPADLHPDPAGPAWQPAAYARIEATATVLGLDEAHVVHRLVFPLGTPARDLPLPDHALATAPAPGSHAALPVTLDQTAELAALARALTTAVTELPRWQHHGHPSEPGEPPAAFAARIGVTEASLSPAAAVRVQRARLVGFTLVWIPRDPPKP